MEETSEAAKPTFQKIEATQEPTASQPEGRFAGILRTLGLRKEQNPAQTQTALHTPSENTTVVNAVDEMAPKADMERLKQLQEVRSAISQEMPTQSAQNTPTETPKPRWMERGLAAKDLTGRS